MTTTTERTAEFEIQVPVAATAERAFAAITDMPAQSRWMLGTRVWVESGTGSAVGDRLGGFTGIGRLGFLDTMTITDVTPELVSVLHTGKIVRGTGWMGARPHGDGAVFIWGEQVELPFGIIGRAGWTVVKPLLALAFRYSLQKLARLVHDGELP